VKNLVKKNFSVLFVTEIRQSKKKKKLLNILRVTVYQLWRVVVCDQETSKNEEAKDRYRAVKIQTQWFVTPGKEERRRRVTVHKNRLCLGKSRALIPRLGRY
jgi:hypothetical protein